MPKAVPPNPKPKPDIVVTPKSNVVEQAPFIGFMLDELIHAQAMAFIPVVELLEDVRKEIAQVNKVVILQSQEIKKWREAWRDAGEYRYIEDTATTSNTEYVLAEDFDYPLKAYQIVNDGASTIKIGHLSTGSPIDEVIAERFQTIYSGDPPLTIKYQPGQGEGIRKIVLKTASGTSAYRLWLLW